MPPNAPYPPAPGGYPPPAQPGYPPQAPGGAYPAAFGAAAGYPAAGVKPARGGLILGLGLVGLLCCGILGLVAFVMGSSDLKAMDSGQMDPSGRGMTNAGRIIGLIAVILWVITVILSIVQGNWTFNVG